MIFSAGNICAQEGWIRQSPMPEYNSYQECKFLNHNTGYMCGGYGKILKTTNSGDNWTIYATNDSIVYVHLFFLNINTGYASGYYIANRGYVVAKTTNGGVNWSLNRLRYAGPICFVDENTGFCSDSTGMLKSTNGGANWFSVVVPTNSHIFAITFLNSLTGFAGGAVDYATCIFKTTDCGIYWQQIDLQETYAVNSISFVDSLNGYAVNYYNMFRTTNGGDNWLKIPNSNYHSGSISFFNSSSGYVVGVDTNSGYRKTVLKTTNSGYNWSACFPMVGSGIYSVTAIDDQFAFSTCFYMNGAIRTTNQGVNWSYVSYCAPYYLKSLFFINAQTGFAAGDGVTKTTNGGATWEETYMDPFFYSAPLTGITMKNAQTGFAIGRGFVLRSTDGGTKWFENFDTAGYDDFTDICFTNQSTGFIIGRPSNYITTHALLRSTDGGDHWSGVSLNNDSAIACSSISFANETTGYIGGATSYRTVVFKTTNGGIDWFVLEFPIISVLMAASFPDVNTGYLCGDGNKIFKTINGGLNWINMGLTGIEGINNIQFLNSNTGYASGRGNQGNEIIKTTDGGVTWFQQTCPNYPPAGWGLDAMYFVNEQTGWVGGTGCQILRTTTGGSVIGIEPVSENTPAAFRLFQNYPNPFNPVTSIRFSLPSVGNGRDRSYVQLIIYDILGREIAVLVNEQLQPGTYEISWNAAGAASGVYFYKLSAGSFTRTMKMILVK